MLRKRRVVQERRRVSEEYLLRLLRDSSRAAGASLARRLRDQLLARSGR
jgi:hypothetical protein